MKFIQGGHRIIFYTIFSLVAFIYIARLFYIQVIEDRYKISANDNVLRRITDYPSRGLIYDRNGKLLVYNEAVYDLMIVPREVKHIDTADFCKLIGISMEDFRKKFQKAKIYSPYKASIFEKQLSAETFAAFQEKLYKFNGFYCQPRTIRKYPDAIAAHLLGYLGEVDEKVVAKNPYYEMGDYIGISGVEQSYENELRGKRGVRYALVDVFNREKGKFEEGRYDTLSYAGENLSLTLDGELQAYAEKLMQNKMGSVVAIEPATGEILAMVNGPTYDPNLLIGRARSKNYGALLKDTLKPLFNRAMMAYYPPGSTFKLTGALSALQENIISNGTSYTHSFTAGSKSVKCHPHPPIALEGAIQYSCNPYFCNVFRSFVDNNKYGSAENGYNTWRKYVNSFGIGVKIGVDMPHELKGLVPQSEYYDKIYGRHRWKATTIFSLGIGQGELGITPLQMANITSIIANRGHYYTPHVVKKIGSQLNSTRNLSQVHYCLVKPETFDVVVYGMQRVVEAGTARSASMIKDSIIVCGKTGTAQNPHGKDHSLFVCFAPKDNPKIAIAVMVENAGFGATWAVPIASLMLEKYLLDTIRRPDVEKKMMEGNLLPSYYYKDLQDDKEEIIVDNKKDSVIVENKRKNMPAARRKKITTP
jgi:penicillin-binding protein 2